MRIITAIIALLMWVEAASAQKEYTLSVSRHQEVPELSVADVNKILNDASQALQTNPGVPCNVRFTLARKEVRTFGSPTIPAIVDGAHKDAVHAIDSDLAGVDFHVKVVDRIIEVCRLPSTIGFRGCSWPHHFRSIIVVHPKRHRDQNGTLMSEAFPGKKVPDHLLWAHEFGHLTGLDHRPNADDPNSDALMHARDVFTYVLNNTLDRVQINARECGCYRGGLLSCEAP